MRLLNFLLHFILMLFIFWAFRAEAQLTENGPQLVQSFVCSVGASPQTCDFPDPVTSGDLEVICWNFNGTTGQTVTPTSGLGTTLAALGGTGTSLIQAAGGGGTATVQCTYGVAVSSGPETFTVTYTSATNIVIEIAEFSNISGTIDTACSATTTSSGASLTTSCTTTKNGDLLVSYAGNWSATTNIYTNPPNEFAAGDGALRAQLLSYQLAGAAGSQSVTDGTNQTQNPSPAWVMETLAFRPAAKTVTTSALPDAALNIPYSAQLKCIGGAGADTFSITAGSLQTGLSLAGATGIISGTPTSGGNSSVTFKCDDGTLNASRALSLTVGANFAGPFLRQYKVSSGISSNVVTFTQPVVAGDLILLICNGPHTSGSLEWVEPTNGTNNYIRDSANDTYHRLPPIVAVAGNNIGNGSTMRVYGAIALSSGTLTVTNTSANSHGAAGCRLNGEDWSGLQMVTDYGAGASQAGFSGSPATLTTGSYTAAVPNEFLHLFAGMATASPLTAVIPSTNQSGITTASGYQSVTSTGAYTESASDTPGNPGAFAVAIQLLGLRPAIPVAAFINIGEKHRRQIW